jgi:hypothetical protein
MTYEMFSAVIEPLAILRGEVKDEPTWRLFYAAVMVPPAPTVQLLRMALGRAANRRYFPSTPELREDCEAVRLDYLKSHPHKRCEQCRDNSGWIALLENGIARVTRCDCFERWRAELVADGIGHLALVQPALPPANRDDVLTV